MLLTSLPVTPPLTKFVKNIGVFDSPRVRFRILSSSSGTSPASPASSASAPAKDAYDASDAGDVDHAGEGNEKDLNSESGGKISGKGEDLGQKCPKRERGEKIFGKRRVEILGGKGLRGETGERILSGKGGKRS